MIDFKPYLEEIEHQISLFKDDNLRIFATSSFQTNSVALLHILATVAPEIPVYMMNTGFYSRNINVSRSINKEFGLNV